MDSGPRNNAWNCAIHCTVMTFEEKHWPSEGTRVEAPPPSQHLWSNLFHSRAVFGEKLAKLLVQPTFGVGEPNPLLFEILDPPLPYSEAILWCSKVPLSVGKLYIQPWLGGYTLRVPPRMKCVPNILTTPGTLFIHGWICIEWGYRDTWFSVWRNNHSYHILTLL